MTIMLKYLKINFFNSFNFKLIFYFFSKKFLREIALEVANRAAVREQQKKEIKRLTTTLSNLRQHQDYCNFFCCCCCDIELMFSLFSLLSVNTQIEQYQSYLQDCRVKQAAGKGLHYNCLKIYVILNN